MELKPDSYTVREATLKLGITEDAVRKRIRRGAVESYKIGGRIYVVIPTDVEADIGQNMSNIQQSLENSGILSNSEAIDTFKLFKETTTITIEMLREQNEMYKIKSENCTKTIEELEEAITILTNKNERLSKKNKDLFQEMIDLKESVKNKKPKKK